MIAVANSEGEPAAQMSYYPYGVVKTAAIFDNTIGPVRMGHQGLIFDRFDVPWDGQRLTAASASGNLGWLDTTPAALTGRGLYQNCNRSYDPGLGRFVQRDPNGSGFALFTSTLQTNVDHFSPKRTYASGMSVHAYVRGRPLSRVDPTGLDSVPTLAVGMGARAMMIGQGLSGSLAGWIGTLTRGAVVAGRWGLTGGIVGGIGAGSYYAGSSGTFHPYTAPGNIALALDNSATTSLGDATAIDALVAEISGSVSIHFEK